VTPQSRFKPSGSIAVIRKEFKRWIEVFGGLSVRFSMVAQNQELERNRMGGASKGFARSQLPQEGQAGANEGSPQSQGPVASASPVCCCVDGHSLGLPQLLFAFAKGG